MKLKNISISRRRLKKALLVAVFALLASCNSGYVREHGQWVWTSYDESFGRSIPPLAAVSVKGIDYIAAFGTVFIFIGIFCIRAAFYKRKFKEETHGVPVKQGNKALLLSAGVICFAVGILLILKSLKII